MKGRIRRLGPLRFQDPVLLCIGLYFLLYYDGSRFLRIGLLAAALHECGHLAAFLLLRHRLPIIELTFTGFCIRTKGERLTPPETLLLAAAGPVTNLLLAGISQLRISCRASLRWDAFWAANLLTGGFNLLPIPPLDGAQILLAACQLKEYLQFRKK